MRSHDKFTPRGISAPRGKFAPRGKLMHINGALALWVKNSADDIFEILSFFFFFFFFFFNFSKKTGFDISCKGDILHELSNSVFCCFLGGGGEEGAGGRGEGIKKKISPIYCLLK